MRRLIVNCILSIVLLMALSNVVHAASESVWDGGMSTRFEAGDGSEYNPYLIRNARDLAYLSNRVSNGVTYKNVYFSLETDINLNNKEWTPIGNSNYSFDGVFMGNSHTIRNLSIENYSDRMGLFGCCRGEIRDVRIENCYINTTMSSSSSCWTGALVGYNYANIINCHSSGTITVLYSSGYGNSAGGLIGINCGNVLYCSSSCDISIRGGGQYCANEAGGLIGLMDGYGAVAASSATGNVTSIASSGSYADAGGLIGELRGACAVANCYAAGDVYAHSSYSASAGGLVSSANCLVVNCFAEGNVSSSHRAYSLFSPWVDGKAINCYVASDQVATTETAYVSRVNPDKFRDADWIKTYLWTEDDGTWTVEDDLPMWTPERIKTIELDSAEDLIALNGKAIVGNYLLTEDIDLSGIAWNPIVVNAGIFDGGGHVISNLNVSGWLYNGGVFGDNAGTVRRLGVENCNVDISCNLSNAIVYAGAVVGDNYGLIQDCYATGNIAARNKTTVDGGSYYENAYAGGICGNNGMGIIERCYANVSTVATSTLAYAYSAGIAASGYYGQITSCFATGSKSSIGGSGGTNTNCYASTNQANFQSNTWISDTLGWDTEKVWIVDNALPKLRAIITNPQIPEPAESAYRIDDLYIHDGSGRKLEAIPQDTFWAVVSVTNLHFDKDALVILATYDGNGKYIGLDYFSLYGFEKGQGAKMGLPVNNKNGDIKLIKAFVIGSFGEMIPLSESLSFGEN